MASSGPYAPCIASSSLFLSLCPIGHRFNRPAWSAVAAAECPRLSFLVLSLSCAVLSFCPLSGVLCCPVSRPVSCPASCRRLSLVVQRSDRPPRNEDEEQKKEETKETEAL